MSLVSIVIPTYNERENLEELVRRIFKVMGKNCEIIIVDDSSPDGTGKLAETLSKKYPVRIIHRPGKLGLGSAVIEGFSVSRGDVLGVMDADLSISGKTTILIERNSEIEIISIGEFVDRFYKKGERGLKFISGFKTLSCPVLKKYKNRDKDAIYVKLGNPKLSNIKAVFRHKVNKINEITYRGGKIQLTGSHSIFVTTPTWSSGKRQSYKIKSASNLKRGLRLVSLETLEKKKIEFPEKRIGFLHVYNRSNLNHRHKNSYEKVPEKIKVTKNLLKLFGYYIADGSVYTKKHGNKSLFFSFNRTEKQYIEEVKKIMKNIFNCLPKIYFNENEVNLKYFRTFIASFFERTLGKGCRGKFIPSFIYFLPKEFITSFLEGWINGDGHRCKKTGRTTISSVNKRILEQLQWLLLLKSINSNINEITTPERKIKNKVLKPTKAYLLSIQKLSDPYNPHNKKPPACKGFITKIESKSYNGYVYDLVGCKGESFFAGISPVLVHNSHPPEKIPEMIKALRDCDIVVGSRHIKGGGVENWSRGRKIISKGATKIARGLTNVKDPMSGFLFLKKSIIQGVNLNPKGYKIGLEILVKGNYKKVKELPYTFVDRKRGKSKLNKREIWNYLVHSLKLYWYRIVK